MGDGSRASEGLETWRCLRAGSGGKGRFQLTAILESFKSACGILIANGSLCKGIKAAAGGVHALPGRAGLGDTIG